MLHCYPQPCDDDGFPADASNRMAHELTESCPFAGDVFPRVHSDTCCSLYAQDAADRLNALGQRKLAERMLKNQTPEGAIRFANDLCRMADGIEREVKKGRRCRPLRPLMDPCHVRWQDMPRPKWVYVYDPDFDKALAVIRVAARWFDKVGRLGFGVEAENQTSNQASG